MNLWQERTILMFGDESVQKLAKSNVLVVGVGGVGAYAAEMLVRAGVGHLTLVDADVVSDTNRNRQLIA
ncbi:MAG: ThiF family adenylyltransferase, partial [Paludibacteraceae bacterium]|nr:ThiF family adenylyltransferase [Paludibacteraceae bacterium]